MGSLAVGDSVSCDACGGVSVVREVVEVVPGAYMAMSRCFRCGSEAVSVECAEPDLSAVRQMMLNWAERSGLRDFTVSQRLLDAD